MSRDNKLITLSLFFWGFGEGLFWYLQPLYLRELGADPITIGAVLSLAAVAALLAHVPAGFLADRFGAKEVMSAGWMLGVAAIVGCYLAPNLFWFSLSWVAYIFTAFAKVPINTFVAQARGAQSVQRAITLVTAGFAGGSVISPALGGWVGDQYGLRTVFLLASLFFVLSFVVMLGLRTQAITAAPARGGRYTQLLANRRLLGFLGLVFAGAFALYIGLPLAPNFLEEVRGFDVRVVGMFGSVNSVGILALSVAFGHRAPRRGFLLAQLLMAVSLGLLLFTSGVGWAGLAYFLRAAWILGRDLLIAQIARVVAPGELGLAIGLGETVLELAVVLAPLAAGWLFDQQPELPLIAGLVLLGLTLPVFWWFGPRE